MNEDSKRCTKCHKVKRKGLFHRDVTRAGGHNPWCKLCRAKEKSRTFRRDRERHGSGLGRITSLDPWSSYQYKKWWKAVRDLQWNPQGIFYRDPWAMGDIKPEDKSNA